VKGQVEVGKLVPATLAVTTSGSLPFPNMSAWNPCGLRKNTCDQPLQLSVCSLMQEILTVGWVIVTSIT